MAMSVAISQYCQGLSLTVRKPSSARDATKHTRNKKTTHEAHPAKTIDSVSAYATSTAARLSFQAVPLFISPKLIVTMLSPTPDDQQINHPPPLNTGPKKRIEKEKEFETNPKHPGTPQT